MVLEVFHDVHIVLELAPFREAHRCFDVFLQWPVKVRKKGLNIAQFPRADSIKTRNKVLCDRLAMPISSQINGYCYWLGHENCRRLSACPARHSFSMGINHASSNLRLDVNSSRAMSLYPHLISSYLGRSSLTSA